MIPLPAPARTGLANRPMAVIEVGPTGIRLLIAFVISRGNELSVLADHAVALPAPARREESSDAITTWLERAASVVEHFAAYAHQQAADPVLVALTGGTRATAGGYALRSRVSGMSGLSTVTIGPQREADLAWSGSLRDLPVHGTVLLGDLSDAGLTLIVTQESHLVQAHYVPLWPERLAAGLFESDPPNRAAIALAEQHARESFAALVPAIPPLDRFVITGEPARGALLLAPRPDGSQTLSLRRLNAAIAHVTSRPAGVLAAETGLSPERVKHLGAGIAIIGAAFATFGLASAEVGEGGVREGLVLDLARYRRRLANR